MPLLSRLNNISKFNRILRCNNWISSVQRNLTTSKRSSFEKPTSICPHQKPNTSLKILCDHNSNHKFERVARYVNKADKGIMSTKESRSEVASSNDETDDISLTFWIFLWAVLAIVASWLYTKLNSSRDESNKNSKGHELIPEADEQIARKLVNEISKNDLVKRSTFRRQRSYEIIDGEVRIHYDMSFVEDSLQDGTNCNENIIDSAEVDSIPVRRSSMEEMELIFPGNLPRIIEEGEEELEDGIIEVEEVVYARAVSSEETCEKSDGDRETVPVVSVVQFDSELNSSPCSEGIDFNKKEEFTTLAESRLGDEEAVISGISQPLPTAEQTNILKITKAKGKKVSNTQQDTQVESSLLSNSDSSSNEDISSTSEESIIENVQNTTIESDDKITTHTSNSTTSSVYKMTEVAAVEGASFTVTRREITKLNATEERCLESELSSLSAATCYKVEENEECMENDKHLDNNWQNSVLVKNDISCHNREVPVTNLHTDVNSHDLTSTCGPSEKKSANEVEKEECIYTESTEETERNRQGNVHEPEVACKLHSPDGKLDEVQGDCCEEVLFMPELDNLDVQKKGFYNGESECGITGKELTECYGEDEYVLSRLEDGSDLLIDNSGDFLFKVIGPIEDEFLEDIEEVDEYADDDHFPLDENENLEMCKPEVELSKSWKSLPSWEKVHHIHHRELDRDADDSDVECSDNEESNGSDHGDMIRSEEVISSNIDSIIDEDQMESDEATNDSNAQHLIMKIMLNSKDDVSLGNNKVETLTVASEVCNTENITSTDAIENGEAFQSGTDLILNTHNRTNVERSGVVPIVSTEGMITQNLKEPEEILLKAKIQNKTDHHLGSMTSKPHSGTASEPVDQSQHTLAVAALVEDGSNSNNIIAYNVLPSEQVAIKDGHLLVTPIKKDNDVSPTKNGALHVVGTAVTKENDVSPAEDSVVLVTAVTRENDPVRTAKIIITDDDTITTGDPIMTARTTVPKDEIKPAEAFQHEDVNEDHSEPAVNSLSHGNLFTSTTNETRNDSEYSDDEVIVAYSHEDKKPPSTKVIYASQVVEEIPRTSEPSSIFSSTTQVLSHVSYETKKFKETSLDGVPFTSSPVAVKYLKEQEEGNQGVLQGETDVDSFSDVDEINIDDIEPEENKSKSVTDLDQALASYGALQYTEAIGTGENDEGKTYGGGLSKSVPDILDSYREESRKEATVKANSNSSIDSLTESLQKKTLSVSSPEIMAVKGKTGSKRVTKIKIVHVKFLEMQDGSGSENTEEDLFMFHGDVPITGKMKRRSRNMSPEDSPVATTSPAFTHEIVDEQFTAEKTSQKELEFGFDDLFKDFPLPPSSTQTIQSIETQQPQQQPRLAQSNVSSYSDSMSNSSTEMIPEGRFVAKYGVIPSQSTRPQYAKSPQHRMKLTDKFQMPQEANSQHERKPAVSPSNHNATQHKHKNVTTRTSNSRTVSAHHSGHLVTVKSSVINDYECSSDADSETSYNTPSPRIKTRKSHRAMVHRDTIDSASSSEPDSPRRSTTKDNKSMSQIFGVEDDNSQQSHNVKREGKMFRSSIQDQNVRKEGKMSAGSTQDPKLFSRFGHLQHSNVTQSERNYNQPQEWDGAMKRNISPSNHYQTKEARFNEVLSRGSNRSMEFNPFTEAEGYDGFEPFERSHSPTSVCSDQSSVFSFNCDFDPMPPPTGTFHPEVYTCENPMCRKQDILLGPEKTSYKSCPACFTYYCSSQCRKLHWPAHKQNCYFGRVNTYVRSIIRLCQRRQDLSMYLSQLARDGYNKKGRGVVMATFNSPELAREFITKGHDAFSGRKPTYSSLLELNREGIISKHRVALMQAVRDYEPNEEFVFNIAVVAVHDIPITPAPRYKLNTVLHCIKMPLNEKIVAREPKECDKVETRLFALPKCSRHEFVNEMEARRHYCRNLSKNLRQYNIRLKEDYQECYKKLCMYVEHDIAFEPMTVYGQRSGLTYKCVIAPEQNYPLNAEYC